MDLHAEDSSLLLICSLDSGRWFCSVSWCTCVIMCVNRCFVSIESRILKHLVVSVLEMVNFHVMRASL